MKYNLSRIMLKAWEIYRKYNIKFSEALHRAWLSAKAEEVNAKRIEVSKKACVCKKTGRRRIERFIDSVLSFR